MEHLNQTRVNFPHQAGRFDFQPDKSSNQNQFSHNAVWTDSNDHLFQRIHPDQTAPEHISSLHDDQIFAEPIYDDFDSSNSEAFLLNSHSDIDLDLIEHQSLDHCFYLDELPGESSFCTSLNFPEQDSSSGHLLIIENPTLDPSIQPGLPSHARGRSDTVPNSSRRYTTEQIAVLSLWIFRNPYPSTNDIDLLTISTGLNAKQIRIWIAKHRRRKLETRPLPADAHEIIQQTPAETANSSLHVAPKSTLASSSSADSKDYHSWKSGSSRSVPNISTCTLTSYFNGPASMLYWWMGSLPESTYDFMEIKEATIQYPDTERHPEDLAHLMYLSNTKGRSQCQLKPTVTTPLHVQSTGDASARETVAQDDKFALPDVTRHRRNNDIRYDDRSDAISIPSECSTDSRISNHSNLSLHSILSASSLCSAHSYASYGARKGRKRWPSHGSSGLQNPSKPGMFPTTLKPAKQIKQLTIGYEVLTYPVPLKSLDPFVSPNTSYRLPGRPVPTKCKRFTCNFCGKTFPRLSTCKRHEASLHMHNSVWICRPTTCNNEDTAIDTAISNDSPNQTCSFCWHQSPDCEHRVQECWTQPEDQRTFFRRDNFKQHLLGKHKVNASTMSGIDLSLWEVTVSSSINNGKTAWKRRPDESVLQMI